MAHQDKGVLGRDGHGLLPMSNRIFASNAMFCEQLAPGRSGLGTDRGTIAAAEAYYHEDN
jgi:hypothetical protein